MLHLKTFKPIRHVYPCTSPKPLETNERIFQFHISNLDKRFCSRPWPESRLGSPKRGRKMFFRACARVRHYSYRSGSDEEAQGDVGDLSLLQSAHRVHVHVP